MLIEKAGLGAVEYREQFLFIKRLVNRPVKPGLDSEVMGHCKEIPVTDMECTNVIFESALLRFIDIIYPHDPLERRSLFVYKLLFTVYHLPLLLLKQN